MPSSIQPEFTEKSKVLNRSVEWLRSRIHEGAWKAGDTLPSLDVLATSAGVARYTMWKAVRILAREKIVFTRRGSGILLGGDKETAGARARSWQHIASHLTQAIHSGEFLPGSNLPPLAKLQIRFSVCYRTMHKAIINLARQRLIQRTGSRYSVPPMHTPGVVPEVFFFNEGFFDNERVRTMVPLSEQQAQKMGFRLVRLEHEFSKPFNAIAITRTISRDAVIGFMVDFWWLGTAERSQYFFSLLSLLYETKKPVAVIDHIGTLALPEPLRSSSRVRTFTIAARIAGEDVGRFLLQAGHRHAAFITTMPHQAWSQRRYSGLHHVFTMADAHIQAYETMPLPGVLPLVCAGARLSRTEMEHLFIPRLTIEEFEQLFELSGKTRKVLRLHDDEVKRIRRQAAAVASFFSPGADCYLAGVMRDRFFEITGHRLHTILLAPEFEKLAADPLITAWVAATSEIGLAAQTFLQSKSIAVPGKISLVAFDYVLRAAVEQITNYDFDMPGLLYQALSFAAGRSKPQQHIIECPGILYQRRSSGRVPRAVR